MPGYLIALICVLGQGTMWCVAARTHYRFWWTAEQRNEPGDVGESRKGTSAAWGFFWPVILPLSVIIGIMLMVDAAMTAPSLKELKQKRIEKREARLTDLKHQIEKAEADLCEATAKARLSQE